MFGMKAVLLIDTDELFLKKMLNLLVLILLCSGSAADVTFADDDLTVCLTEFLPDMITDFSFLDYGDYN